VADGAAPDGETYTVDVIKEQKAEIDRLRQRLYRWEEAHMARNNLDHPGQKG
jgi:hypothetical protein